MGLLDIFKSKAKASPNVLESLLQAAEQRDGAALLTLCEAHGEEIRQRFAQWSALPESVRSDAVAVKRHAEGLIAVARAFERLGDASLLKYLMRNPEESPLHQWKTDLLEAQSLVDSGKLPEAIDRLQSALSKYGQLPGTGADFYLPRTLGLLGVAHFRSGQKASARECMARAKALCEASGDTEGAAIYEGNLQQLADA
jgi:tetratricopeptide (TPR) repeat protein